MPIRNQHTILFIIIQNYQVLNLLASFFFNVYLFFIYIVQSKSKTSQSLFRQNLSKFGQINESNEDLSENSKFDLDSLANEINFLDTQKAWSLLKTNGIYDAEPENYKFTESKLINYYEDNESARSPPNHNIPYVQDKKVQNSLEKI